MPIFGKKKTKEELEVERRITYRKTVNELNIYIEECKRLSDKYWQAGKKAAKLGDENMQKQFAYNYLKMQENIKRTQKLMLYLEGIFLEKEGAKLSGKMISLLKEISSDMKEEIGMKEIMSVEKDLSVALEKTEKTETALDLLMDRLGDAIQSSSQIARGEVGDISKAMKEEGKIDEKIEERIKEIEEKMKAD